MHPVVFWLGIWLILAIMVLIVYDKVENGFNIKVGDIIVGLIFLPLTVLFLYAYIFSKMIEKFEETKIVQAIINFFSKEIKF